MFRDPTLSAKFLAFVKGVSITYWTITYKQRVGPLEKTISRKQDWDKTLEFWATSAMHSHKVSITHIIKYLSNNPI